MSARTDEIDAELARQRFDAVLAEVRHIAPLGTVTLSADVARQLALEVDRLRAALSDIRDPPASLDREAALDWCRDRAGEALEGK